MTGITHAELEAALVADLGAGLDKLWTQTDIYRAARALLVDHPDWTLTELRLALVDAAERATDLPGVVLGLTACLV